MILLLAGGLLVLAAVAGGPVLERHRWAGEMHSLRASLDRARSSADSCRAALAREEEAFLRFHSRVDSLRDVVDAYEDDALGGVPQADYRDYIERFEQYNDLVAAWGGRADSLQAGEARCRALVEAHNLLSDSVNALQEERRTSRRR